MNCLLDNWGDIITIKVLVSFLNQGDIYPTITSIMAIIRSDPRFDVTIEYPTEQPVDNNRNLIARRVIEGGYDFIVMIDGNDTIPQFNPLDLIELDKDIVGAAYPQWREGDIYWVAVDKVPNGYKPIPPERREGLQEIDAIGTGCICIKRKVLEHIKAPFERKWSEQGIQLLGQDFYFCEKAKLAGFEVWVDWTKVCDHLKTVSLLSILNLLGGGNE